MNRRNPGYFVTCSNGIATCEQCPGNTVFDDKLDVCVNQKAYKPLYVHDPNQEYRPHQGYRPHKGYRPHHQVYNQYKSQKTYSPCK